MLSGTPMLRAKIAIEVGLDLVPQVSRHDSCVSSRIPLVAMSDFADDCGRNDSPGRKQCKQQVFGNSEFTSMTLPAHLILSSSPRLLRFFPITRTSLPRRPAYLIAILRNVYSSSR
jgi:hypothetical protein